MDDTRVMDVEKKMTRLPVVRTSVALQYYTREHASPPTYLAACEAQHAARGRGGL